MAIFISKVEIGEVIWDILVENECLFSILLVLIPHVALYISNMLTF